MSTWEVLQELQVKESMNTNALIGQDELMLPTGFQAAGVKAGIKSNAARDLALWVSDAPATMAGVFTTNQVPAAPVTWCRARLAAGDTGRALVINSGNANACTGAAGLADTERMAQCVAQALDCPPETVWVCSTGHIGDRLPMDRVTQGIAAAAERLQPDGGLAAADAMRTTDLHIKHWTVKLTIAGCPVTVTGVAKGAGMIEPNMATMLACLLTDAAVEPAAWQEVLATAVNASFNRITVDGDQSTNDTVLGMANGRAAHGATLNPAHPDWADFAAAVSEVCTQLALKIVDDGEGSAKRITVQVTGAAHDEDADKAARAIANSFLVKTSWAGREAIWGRVMDCLGYSGAKIVPDAVDVWYDDRQAVHAGVAADTPYAHLQAVIQKPRFVLKVDLNIGTGEAVIYTCEITEEYVKINIV